MKYECIFLEPIYTFFLFVGVAKSYEEHILNTRRLEVRFLFFINQINFPYFDVCTNYDIVDFIFNDILNEKLLLQLKIHANKTNRMQ